MLLRQLVVAIFVLLFILFSSLSAYCDDITLFNNARKAEKTGEYQKAEQLYKAYANQVPKSHFNYGVVYNNLSEIYRQQDRYQDTIDAIDIALPLYQSEYGTIYHVQICHLYQNRGYSYYNLGLNKKAISDFIQASNICEKSENVPIKKRLTLLENIISINNNIDNDDDVIKYYMILEPIAKESGRDTEPGYGETLDSVGDAYFSKGDYEKAEYCFNKALPLIEEEYGVDSERADRVKSDLIASRKNKNLVKHSKELDVAADTVNNLLEQADALAGKGTYNNYLKAEELYLKAEQLIIANQLEPNSTLYYNLGTVQRYLEKNDDAIRSFDKFFGLEKNDSDLKLKALDYIAHMQLRELQPEKSLTSYKKAYMYSKEINAPKELQDDLWNKIKDIQSISSLDNYIKQNKKPIRRWNDDTKEILVYIPPLDKEFGNKVTYNTKNLLIEAFKEWEEAIEHRVTYKFVADPEVYDVKIVWGKIEERGVKGQISTETGGSNDYLDWHVFMKMNDIKINIINFKGELIPRNNFYGIALHEIGHSLGFMGHSNLPTDVMSNIEGVDYIITGIRAEKPHLSARDRKTMQLLYRQKPEITNPNGYHLSEFEKFKKKYLSENKHLKIKTTPLIQWTD